MTGFAGLGQGNTVMFKSPPPLLRQRRSRCHDQFWSHAAGYQIQVVSRRPRSQFDMHFM